MYCLHNFVKISFYFNSVKKTPKCKCNIFNCNSFLLKIMQYTLASIFYLIQVFKCHSTFYKENYSYLNSYFQARFLHNTIPSCV